MLKERDVLVVLQESVVSILTQGDLKDPQEKKDQKENLETLVTDSINEAARRLRQGELVIFPTETVYGLGANALDAQAVAGIYWAKKRPADNPLIVHIHSLEQVDQLTHSVPDYAWELLQAFFPGSLTLLLPKRRIIPDATTAGSDKVCLRMPSLPLAQNFLKACDLPVAAPSANLSSRPSPTRWEDCLEDMNGRVAAILKGPEATFGLESTIVDCTGTYPTLMRPGAVELEELALVVPDIRLNPAHNKVTLPGMKYRHYAPQAEVKLLSSGEQPPLTGQGTAYIGLSQPDFPVEYKRPVGSLLEYAHQLFAFFRECDRRNLRYIYAEQVDESGLGRAIMNRLNKAVAGI